MPQWIDIRAHGVALLVRSTDGGQKELVLQRTAPGADIPTEVAEIGFVPQGDIHVRQDTRFNLKEIRRIFPQAAVADLSIDDIAYVAPIASIAAPAQAEPAPEPEAAPAPAVGRESVTSEPSIPTAWARVPRPRFREEATMEVVDGRLVVSHGESRFTTERQKLSPGAIDEVHALAVSAASRGGDALPFAVLVDYPEIAFAGMPKQAAASRVMRLLSRLGIAERLMEGETGYCKLSNDPFMDLVIERLPYPDGDRFVLTHYRDHDLDRVLDAEMVFLVRHGRLFLKETAVENVMRGGELRGCDTYFANMFSSNLLKQGFDEAKVTWPDDSSPDPERSAPEPDADTPEGVAVSEAGGLAIAVDSRPDAVVSSALGGAPADAVDGLSAEPVRTLPVAPPQAVGENAFGQPVLEDGAGRRYVELAGECRAQPNGGTGLEYMTTTEAAQYGAILPNGLPAYGEDCFGQKIAAAWRDEGDRLVVCAIEKRSRDGYFGLRLNLADGGEPSWEALGTPWMHGRPTPTELRLAVAHAAPDGFDALGLINELNARIDEANAQTEDPRYQNPQIDPEMVRIRQPEHGVYEMRLADGKIPVGGVRIRREDDLWRAESLDGKQTYSARGSLEGAFGWAFSYVTAQQTYYQLHLHRIEDGYLEMGMVPEHYAQLRHLAGKISRREQVGGTTGPWADYGIASSDVALRPEDLRCTVAEDGRITIGLRDTPLTYQVFQLGTPAASERQVASWSAGSIATLLRTLDRDLRWERVLASHPAGEQMRGLQDYFIDRMREQHGDRWEHRVPGEGARETILAIADRNLPFLLDRVARSPDNPCTKALFEHVAGEKLGTNRTTREDVVYRYCGYTPEQAAQHREQRDNEARLREREREARRVIEKVENAQIRVRSEDGGPERVISQKQYIDELFARGMTKVVKMSGSGAVPRYALCDPTTGSGYKIQEPMTAYARHLMVIRETRTPEQAPAPDHQLTMAF